MMLHCTNFLGVNPEKYEPEMPVQLLASRCKMQTTGPRRRLEPPNQNKNPHQQNEETHYKRRSIPAAFPFGRNLLGVIVRGVRRREGKF